MGEVDGRRRRWATAWLFAAVAAVASLAALTVGGSSVASRASSVPSQDASLRVQGKQGRIDLDRVIATLHRRGVPARGGARPFGGSSNSPAVAWDGSTYLVVWSDSRSGVYDIYGARVNAGGAVLDPGGFAISTAAGYQEAPAIAFDGTNYLVAWTDFRSGVYPDLYGARVSRTGTVLDPGGIPISNAAFGQGEPAIAFDGTNYLVAWGDSRTGTGRVYGSRVSPAGTILDPAGIAISSGAGSQGSPALAFDGTNYLVAWNAFTADFDVYGARVSTAGTVLDQTAIPISTALNAQQLPALAFDGTNYLVAWGDQRSGGFDIFGARLNTTGTVLDPDGIGISTATGEQNQPALAFGGVSYLGSWDDPRSGGYDIYGARVSTAGAVLDPGGIGVSTAPDVQASSALAFDGTYYLVVWSDTRSGSEIYGARVNTAGTVIDPAGIWISGAPPPPPVPPPPPPPPPPPIPPPPPPPCCQDTRPPVVRALPSTGRRGRIALLRFTVYDNSGVSRVLLVVFHGRKALAGGATNFRRTRRGVVYLAAWRVPRKTPRKLTHCVQAEDRAGNRSKVSCARLRIR